VRKSDEGGLLLDKGKTQMRQFIVSSDLITCCKHERTPIILSMSVYPSYRHKEKQSRSAHIFSHKIVYSHEN
jgi:hypothetical protein